jgi:hypothetical protein
MGFGYSLSIPDDQLMRLSCSLFGYSDEPPRYMLGSGGNIQRISAQQLYYSVDASRGQRGTPLYTWCDGFVSTQVQSTDIVLANELDLSASCRRHTHRQLRQRSKVQRSNSPQFSHYRRYSNMDVKSYISPKANQI